MKRIGGMDSILGTFRACNGGLLSFTIGFGLGCRLLPRRRGTGVEHGLKSLLCMNTTVVNTVTVANVKKSSSRDVVCGLVLCRTSHLTSRTTSFAPFNTCTRNGGL